MHLSHVVVLMLLATCYAITYKHSQAMSDVYTLYWTVEGDSIYFKTVVKCTGWVGFGLSESGYMAPDSDVVLMFNEKNNATLFDCWTIKHKQPPQDVELTNEKGRKGTVDWNLTYGKEISGVTTFEFNRKLNTTDPFDRIIDPTAKTQVIWSYNIDTKPQKTDSGYQFQQHDDMNNIELVLGG